MEKEDLDINTITFGKYKDKKIETILKDRKYSKWLLEQDWFEKNYEYLYNRIKDYNPQKYFINEKEDDENINFLESYIYFNLINVEKVDLSLSENEKICYKYYLKLIKNLKSKIIERIENCMENPFDIKAPTKWLQKFETDTGLKRDDFKDFINTYELPNITYIIEDIKKQGGIEYKGGKSFLIAKNNSEKQEKFWEDILKKKYGDEIGTQFKYENCIFDFINISSNIIYECKIGLKDFNEEQYDKYLLTLNKYKIIYLIGNDCIINIENKIIYTIDEGKYLAYQYNIPLLSKPTKFDNLIIDYKIVYIDNIENFI
jgi:hypothetical protein